MSNSYEGVHQDKKKGKGSICKKKVENQWSKPTTSGNLDFLSFFIKELIKDHVLRGAFGASLKDSL